jgi:hypothetical protein
MRHYSLRDDQWDRIRDFLPGREGHVGSTAETNRLFAEAGDDRVMSSLVGASSLFGRVCWQRLSATERGAMCTSAWS